MGVPEVIAFEIKKSPEKKYESATVLIATLPTDALMRKNILEFERARLEKIGYDLDENDVQYLYMGF